jgi:predicted  nucleic acid-binding Zn-ribbon protein
MYIVYPYLVLRDRLKALREEEQGLVADREELEQQYFTRTLGKSTFEELVVQKQEEISDIRSDINELEQLLAVEHVLKHPRALHTHMKTLDEEPSFTKRVLQQLNAIPALFTGPGTEQGDGDPVETPPIQDTPSTEEEPGEETGEDGPGESTELSAAEKKETLQDALADAADRIKSMSPGRGKRTLQIQATALETSVDRAADEDTLDELAEEVKQFITRVNNRIHGQAEKD